MSGGGATQQSTLPAYQESTHGLLMTGADPGNSKTWLTGASFDGDFIDNPSVLRFIQERGLTDAGGNPYDGVSAFDPLTELDDVDERLSEFVAAVDALDVDDDWDTYITKARTESATDIPTLDVDSLMESVTAAARRTVGGAVAEAFERAAEADRDALVAKALAAFSKRHLKEHLKVLNRFTAPMAQGGAINSSSYVVGVALLESEFEDRLAAFDAEFTLPLTREAFSAFMGAYVDSAKAHLQVLAQARLQEQQLKQSYLLEGTREMVGLLRHKMELDRAGTMMTGDLKRQKIIALSEESQQNLDYDVHALQWDMDLFQQSANVLSAQQGSVVPRADKASRVSSALSGGLGGAASGAALGTQIGAAGGPIGATGGAVIGGVAGLIGGFLE